MPYKHSVEVKKFRVSVEELTSWKESPTREEMDAPRASSDPTPDYLKEESKEQWLVTDEVTSAKKAVVAGYLRSLANELDPPKKTGMRGIDD